MIRRACWEIALFQDEDDRPTIGRDDWLRMAEAKREAARLTVDSKLACGEAWMAAGFAVEFSLKAYIMRRFGMNRWPDKQARPELYVHDIRKLFDIAGVDLSTVPKASRGAVRTILDWDRLHEYAGRKMARSNARSMVEAAFGPEGVIEWLKTLP